MGIAYDHLQLTDSSEYYRRLALKEGQVTRNFTYLPASYISVAEIFFNSASTSIATVIDKNDPLTIYPNPVSDHVGIQSDFQADADFRIINLVGVEVMRGTISSPEASIALKNLENGFYQIEITANGKKSQRGFVIQKD